MMPGELAGGIIMVGLTVGAALVGAVVKLMAQSSRTEQRLIALEGDIKAVEGVVATMVAVVQDLRVAVAKIETYVETKEKQND
jgi:hypothetical protein